MQILEKALVALASLFILAMLILMNVEVVLRYVVGTSTRVSEEYSSYLFCAATMAGLVPAVMGGRMLRISAVLSILPLKARAFWEACIAIISAGFCLIIVQQTWALVQMSYGLGSVSVQYSQTPLMYPQMLVPLGFLVLAIAFLARGFLLARELHRGHVEVLSGENDVLE